MDGSPAGASDNDVEVARDTEPTTDYYSLDTTSNNFFSILFTIPFNGFLIKLIVEVLHIWYFFYTL